MQVRDRERLSTDKGYKDTALICEGCEKSSWCGKWLQSCHNEFGLPHHPVLFSLHVQFQVSGHESRPIWVLLVIIISCIDWKRTVKREFSFCWTEFSPYIIINQITRPLWWRGAWIYAQIHHLQTLKVFRVTFTQTINQQRVLEFKWTKVNKNKQELALSVAVLYLTLF